MSYPTRTVRKFLYFPTEAFYKGKMTIRWLRNATIKQIYTSYPWTFNGFWCDYEFMDD